MNVIFAIMFRIWGLMCIKTTVPARMVLGLARTAAAIHGYCKASRQRPALATATGRIPAPVGKRNPRRSILAATVTAMVHGNSIRPASIGAPALAETAVQRTTTTLRTA